ncbi:MAG TPA: hypothetical protein VJZ76_22415 [Thermoanaerobaculia bacterium]|nr:hypothetical protein [Thermoanaerobaculia bacterium]
MSRWVLLALQVAYLAAMLLFGRFLGGDEIAYKAAGREWAKSGTFIAPELRGFGAWRDPADPYALRRGFGPPVYTFAFGLFVKLFGFNPTTSVAFDALIHILLGWATFALARALAGIPDTWAAIAAAATLPLGTAGRPDELAAVFAMFGSAIVLRRLTARRAAAAGVLFGLSAGTSLVAAGILLVWPLCALWQQRRGAFGSALAFGACAGAVFALTMLPLVLIIPYGLRQLTHHAGASVHESFAWAIRNSIRYGLAHYLAAAAALVVAAVHLLRGPRREWLTLWLPPLVALAALVVLLPVKYYYVWLIVPSLFAAAAVAMAPWRGAFRAAVAVIALALWCAAASRFALMTLIRATLPADQRMGVNVALLHQVIPPNAGVMTYDFWPALAGSMRTYSTEADPPWSDVDYLVLTGNGSGTPGQPQTLRPEQLAYVRDHFAPIVDRLNRRPFALGPIHTHSAWGYGPLILRRVK